MFFVTLMKKRLSGSLYVDTGKYRTEITALLLSTSYINTPKTQGIFQVILDLNQPFIRFPIFSNGKTSSAFNTEVKFLN